MIITISVLRHLHSEGGNPDHQNILEDTDTLERREVGRDVKGRLLLPLSILICLLITHFVTDEICFAYVRGSRKKEKLLLSLGFPGGASGKEPACQHRTHERHRLDEDPLEEGIATLSSILAGGIHGQRRLAGCSPQGAQCQTRLK